MSRNPSQQFFKSNRLKLVYPLVGLCVSQAMRMAQFAIRSCPIVGIAKQFSRTLNNRSQDGFAICGDL